ncbi:MAG: hypothetical protein HY363_02565 [Candidatus Aenigmarchaeota archaeon]|nr:hypothetical protein [Candidatus Aenigmarchaeota archaeon]
MAKAKTPKATVRSKSKSVVTTVRVEKADKEKKQSKQAVPYKINPRAKGDIFAGRLDKEDFDAEHEDFLEDEEHPWTHEEQEARMHTGRATPDVYSPEGRDELEEEEGEIEPWEEAFMEGAETKGELGECANCEKPLCQGKDHIVEREIKGRLVWFCSSKCASAGKKR